MKPFKVDYEAYEVFRREVKKHGHTGFVGLPRRLVGKEVVVIITDDKE